MTHKILPVAAMVLAWGAPAFDKDVTISELPPAVRQSVERETRGATIRELSKETENGRVYYEAETSVNGKQREILFDESGKVVKVEQQVALDSIPAGARSAIEQQAAGGQVLGVKAVTRDGKTTYKARVQKAGEKFHLKVTPEGTPAW
jgi:uncharacterized membrane protein YkoI